MHFINVSTGLLLLNAFLSTTAIPIQPQAAVLEVRTLPVNTDGSQARLAELQEMKTIRQGPQAQANGIALPEYWDGEIARVSKLLEITRGLKTKRDPQVRTSSSVTLLKEELAEIRRLKEQSEKAGAKAVLPPSYWDHQWNQLNRLLQLVEGAKTSKPKTQRELEARAAPAAISLEALLVQLKQAQIRSEQELSWPPPTYWGREIKNVEQQIALQKSPKAMAPQQGHLEARGVLFESHIVALKNFYNAQRKQLSKIHIAVLEEKLGRLKYKDELRKKGKLASFKTNTWDRRSTAKRKKEIKAMEEKIKAQKASYEQNWPSSPQPHKPDLEARGPPPGMAEQVARLKEQFYFGTHSANRLSVSHFEKEIETLKAKAARLESGGTSSVSDGKTLKNTYIRIHMAEKGLAKARANGPPQKRDLEARAPVSGLPRPTGLRHHLWEGRNKYSVLVFETQIHELKLKVAKLHAKATLGPLGRREKLYLHFMQHRIYLAEMGLANARKWEQRIHKRDLQARGAALPGSAMYRQRLMADYRAGLISAHRVAIGLLEHAIQKLKIKLAQQQGEPKPSWRQRTTLKFTRNRIEKAEKDLKKLKEKEETLLTKIYSRDLEARAAPVPLPGTAASSGRLGEQLHAETSIARATAIELFESEIVRLNTQIARLQSKPNPSYFDEVSLMFRRAQLYTVQMAIARVRAPAPSSPRGPLSPNAPSSPRGPFSPNGPSSPNGPLHKRDLEARGPPVPGALYAGTKTPYMAALDLLEGEVRRFKGQAAIIENKAAPSWFERQRLRYWNYRAGSTEKSLEQLRAKGSSSAHKQDLEAQGLHKRDLEVRAWAPSPDQAARLATAIKSLDASAEKLAASRHGVPPSIASPLNSLEEALTKLRTSLHSLPTNAGGKDAALPPVGKPGKPQKRDLEARGPPLSPDQAARLAASMGNLGASLRKLRTSLQNLQTKIGSKNAALQPVSKPALPHKRDLEARAPPPQLSRDQAARLAASMGNLGASLRKLRTSLQNLQTKIGSKNTALQPVSKPALPQKRDLEARAPPPKLSPDQAARLATSMESLAASLHKLQASLLELQTKVKAGSKNAAPQPVSKNTYQKSPLLPPHKRDLEARVAAPQPVSKNTYQKSPLLPPHKRDLEARGPPPKLSPDQAARLATSMESLAASLHKLQASLLELQTKVKAGSKNAAPQPVSKNTYQKSPLLPPHKRDLEARGPPPKLSPDQAARLATSMESLAASLHKLQASLLELQTKVKAGSKNAAPQPVSKNTYQKSPLLPPHKRDLEARAPPPPQNVLGSLRAVQKAALNIEINMLKEKIESSKNYLARAQLSPPPKFGLDRNPARAELRGYERALAKHEETLAKMDKPRAPPTRKRGLEARAPPTKAQKEAAKKRIQSLFDDVSAGFDKVEIGWIRISLTNDRARVSELERELIPSKAEKSELKTLKKDITQKEKMIKKLEQKLEKKLEKKRPQKPKRGLEARALTTPAEVNGATKNLHMALDRMSATLIELKIAVLDFSLFKNRAIVSRLQSDLQNKKTLSSDDRWKLVTLSKDIETQEKTLAILRKKQPQNTKRALGRKTPPLHVLEEKLAKAMIELAQIRAQARLPGASKETRERLIAATFRTKLKQATISRLRANPHKRSLDKKTQQLERLQMLEQKHNQAKIEVAEMRAKAQLPGASSETRHLASIMNFGLWLQKAKISRLRTKAKVEVSTSKPHKRSLEQRALPLRKTDLKIHLMDLQSMRLTSFNRGQMNAVEEFDNEITKIKWLLNGWIKVPVPKGLIPPKAAKAPRPPKLSAAEKGKAKVEVSTSKPHKRSLEERALPLRKTDLKIHLMDLQSMRLTSFNRGQMNAVEEFDNEITKIKWLLNGWIKVPVPKGLIPPKAAKPPRPPKLSAAEKGKAKVEASRSG
ncbi:hypothetical protein HYFRA_00003865 [Hymenoscyphus fraxineus]|uniref:Uncharacterized protein n=1 Tax=Hymenoscyphus fraxineus TaxID=746836 RepID=A0A9N9PK07_9HELO|nr:hypothetical protein HYFRA_00003865 [Hymenoscyphus fraxineus]